MKNLVLSLSLLATTLPVWADRTDTNGNLWTGYIGDHPFGDSPWGVHLEAQMRLADFGDEKQQFLLRPGINYQFDQQTSFSGGFAWVETQPYGDFPAIHEFPEHRFWEQVSHQASWMGLQWTHRFRLEQRWIGEMAQDSDGGWDVENWRYENRLRYMLRTSIPLVPSKDTYLFCSDEVFLNFGKNVNGNDFDQNRAIIGIGHRFNAFTRLEVGYMHQTIQRRGGDLWENNHTVVCYLVSSQPF